MPSYRYVQTPQGTTWLVRMSEKPALPLTGLFHMAGLIKAIDEKNAYSLDYGGHLERRKQELP